MKPRLVASLIVFWPWIIIAVEFAVIWWANARGCKIWALGPEPCLLFGHDIGEQLYPLWSVGYQIAFSFMWVIPALIVWALVEVVTVRRNG